MEQINIIFERYLGPREDLKKLKEYYYLYVSALKKNLPAENEKTLLENKIKDIRKFAAFKAYSLYEEASKKHDNAILLFYFLVVLTGLIIGWSVYLFFKNLEHSITSQELSIKLEKTQTEYKNLVENINDIFFMTDCQGKIIYISPVCEKIGGYKPAELIDKNFQDFIHPQDLTLVINAFKEILSGKVFPSEYRVKKKDDSWLWVRSSAKPFYEGALPKGIMGVLSDITLLKEKEEKITESERWYKDMFEKHKAMKWIVDPKDGKIVDANDAAAEFYGYPKEKLIGMRVSQINVMGEKIKEEIDKAVKKEKNYFEFVHRLADGKIKNVRVYSSPVKKGDKEFLYSIMQDVTKEKEALDKTKTLFNMIDSSLNEIYVFREDDLKFEYANAGALENLGYSLEEIKFLTPLDIKPEMSKSKFYELIKPLKKGEKRKVVFYTAHKRKNGSSYPVEVHLQYYTEDSKGYFFAAIDDISERVKAEENIKKLNSLYFTLSQSNQAMVKVKSEKELFEEIPKVLVKYGGFHTVWIGMMEKDKSVKCVFSFGSGADFIPNLKIKAEKNNPQGECPTAKSYLTEDICYENDWQSKVPENFKEISEKTKIKSVCSLPIKKNGKIYRNLSVYSSEKDYFTAERIELLKELIGDMEYALSKISAEENLVKSEERYRALFENMSAACCVDEVIYDEKGNPKDYRILDINSSFEKVIGYKKEDVIGKLSAQVYGGPNPLADIFYKVADTGESISMETYFAPLKKHLYITVSSPKKGMFSTVFYDITDKKKYEEDLEKTRAAIEQSGDTVVITDIMGNIEYVNPAFEKITGYSKEEALGKNPRILKSGVQERKFYEELWETVSSGMIWSGIMVNRKKDGSLYTEEAVISPVFGKNGNIINFVAVKRDISEKIKTQKELMHAQKIEAIGLLAGGVAHDFNNILTAINSYAEIIYQNSSQENKEDIKEIISAAQRGVSLTKQLLAFTRKQVSSPKICDINEVIKGFEKMLRRLIGENITLSIKYCDKPCLTVIDPSQLEQIIMNLVLNSRDAVGESGYIEIEISKNKIETFLASKFSDSSEIISLKIKDNGCGFDEESKKHLFEPFYTTKEKGKGTGLGLSTVLNLLRQNKGEIYLESEKGKGSVFTLLFAESKNNNEENRQEPYSFSINKEYRETVLLVEDEDSLLKLGKRILSGLGYKVFTASNAQEALSLALEIEKIDILITDLIMPGMSGKELSDKLISQGKIKKTLFMSGYTDDIIGKHGVLEKGVAFIYKPFSVNSFLAKVRETLDSK